MLEIYLKSIRKVKIYSLCNRLFFWRRFDNLYFKVGAIISGMIIIT